MRINYNFLQKMSCCPHSSKIGIRSKTPSKLDKIIVGLDYIIQHPKLRDQITDYIKADLSINTTMGRQGMPLFNIFVLATIKQATNMTFVELHNATHKHNDVRTLLNVDNICSSVLELGYEKGYSLNAIKDNVHRLSAETLNEINSLIVNFSHNDVSSYKEFSIEAKTDSFVVQTNVEFPVDYNLLQQAIIKLFSKLRKYSLQNQQKYTKHYKALLKKIKSLTISIQRTRNNNARRVQLVKELLQLCSSAITMINQGYSELKNLLNNKQIVDFTTLFTQANILHDQVNRRVINGETIPHDEKIFSLYETHTEWINKGKAGVPVELGVKVAITTDQYQFIIHHEVMHKTTDSQMIQQYTNTLLSKYPNIQSMSLDKGYYSISNQEYLSSVLPEVILPTKGKKSEAAKIRESATTFKQKRQQHPAIESDIHGLQSCGLDKCRNKGLKAFHAYIALTIIARNLWNLGRIVLKRYRKRSKLEYITL